MVLLALMTLLGLTLVLVTAQGRLSALAASRKGLQPEHDASELASVMTQVAAGSTDPNSSFGAHGLLEDIYGQPQFFGQIMPATAGPTVLPVGETVAGATVLSGGNNGTLLQLLVTSGNVNAGGATGLGGQTAAQYHLPQNSGAFCGQVITMVTGPAAGQSARVVGYYYLAGATFATMQVSSFGGIVPSPGDQFMINGRPFSGTGFGLDLTKFSAGGPWILPYLPTGDGPLLTATENTATVVSPTANLPGSNLPYAYLPNHARIALTNYVAGAPGYWDPAGPGGANEPYDAPDFQNLMLAMHYWSPFLLPSPPNSVPQQVGVVTPIPSLHRPELVGWYYNQAIITGNNGISMGNPNDGATPPGQYMLRTRRKVILRPEPTDNYFVDTNGNNVWDAREPFHDVDGSGNYSTGDVYADGTKAFLDLNGDGQWTAGETDYSGNTFNPVTGCWYIAANGGWALDTNAGLDVDNDRDGTPDSIWVDAGLPVHTEADGTFTKNLAAVLVIDLDGKVNLNAHGTLAQVDGSRYPGNSVYGPLAGDAGSQLLYGDAMFQRNAPVGQGYGPADVNPLHLFVRSHSPANVSVTGTPVLPTHTYSNGTTSVLTTVGGSVFPDLYYRTFLQGYNYQSFLASYNGYLGSGASPPVLQVDGRYGESARLTVPGLSGFSFPGVYPPGSYLSPAMLAASPPMTLTNQLLNGPRPGWSQWYDPYSTSLLVGAGYSAYWLNDPVALARFSDIRPGLLTPPSLSATPFFFDFLASPATHQPTAHGTPSDLHSRGVLMADLTGRPYYGGTAFLPWQAMPASYYATLYEYALNPISNFYPYPYLQGEYVLNDAVDTQYEMDLTQNAKQGGQNTGNSIQGIPDFASIDAKLTPSELEGMLRAYEQGAGTAADSGSLLKRLNDLETAANLSSTPLYSMLANKDTASATPPTKVSPRNDIRLAVTTESWDLPMPNLALTPRQMLDVVQYVDTAAILGQNNTLVNTGTLNLNNIGLVDLARVRIYADNYLPGGSAFNPLFPFLGSVLAAPDVALFGDMKNLQPNVGVFPAIPVWPLLAPETVLGMRLDVNRLLGNGMDDNGNGVVDEPAEVFWQNAGVGESLIYPFSKINTSQSGPAGQINTGVTNQATMVGVLDLNNDGFYPIGLGGTTSLDPQTGTLLPADPTGADSRARQLLAKQLYCLAMLLLDDRPYYNPATMPVTTTPPYPGTTTQTPWPYGVAEGTAQNIMAQIFNSNGAPWPNLPTATFSALVSAGNREQAAYVIAQWAVNVVDFRDRDSIMTPFEFDLYPFRADPYVTANVAMEWVQAAELNLTWNVDDIIDPAYGAPLPFSHQDDSQAYRGLVWGCERPELLMTETVAFHDRGTADTKKGENINDSTQTPSTGPDTLYQPAPGTIPYDKDFDQVRRPRGSLIVELFNPTSYWDAPQFDVQSSGTSYFNGLPQPWQQPDGNGNQGRGVNLAQVAEGQPLNGSGPAVSPVWRLAIAYSPNYNESAFYTGAAASPYSTTNGKYLDPRVPVLPFVPAGPATTSTVIHRAVYFAPYQNGFVTGGGANLTNTAYVNEVLLHRSFFADPDVFLGYSPATGLKPAALLLPPGQYALVGPGNQDPVNNNGNYMIYAGKNYEPAATPSNIYPSSFQLGNQLAYNTISYVYGNATPWTDLNGNQPYSVGYLAGNTIKPVIGVPIQTTWFQSTGGNPVYVPHNMLGAITGGTTIATTLRMSVSEPEHGYPLWPAAVGTVKDDYFYYSAVGTPNTAAIPTLQYFPQHPFDSGLTDPQTGTSYSPFSDVPNPYVAPDGVHTQTMVPGYTVIFLQRLANPLQAWDANMNPYITVDSMPVDLASYTGEPNATGSTATVEPVYLNGSPGSFNSFETRRRGYNPLNGSQTVLTAQGTPNVWTPLPLMQPGYNPYSGGQFGVTNADGTVITPMPKHTLGYVNAEYSNGVYWQNGLAQTGSMPAATYNGDPKTPFPWLAWNNRPYVSQYELMLVPGSSPSSQLQDFGMLGWNGAVPLNEFQPYTPLTTATPGQILTPTANTLPAAQFMQLLNFFNNEQTLTTNDTTNLLPNLFRIFEFLQVPSRYTGTQEMLNPSQFAGDNAALVANTATGAMPTASHLFHTPFNWLPRYREPGRINLNTIFDPVVFQSLMDDYPGTLYANMTAPPVTGPFGALVAYNDLNPVTGFADAMLFPRGLWASLTRSRQGFYEDPRRPYLWSGMPVPGPYTVNYAAAPLTPVAVPNPSAPPNPITQFAFNTTAGVPGINADVPTYFANPFRPDGAAAFVPPADTTFTPPAPLSYNRLMHQWTYPSPVAGTAWNNGVNATLLRSQESAAALPTYTPGPEPLYPISTLPVTSSEQMTALESLQPIGKSSFPMVVNLANATLTPPAPLINPPSPGPLAQFDDTAFDLNNPNATYTTGSTYRNAGQDAAFQYQMLTRLGNTTTNRSNVYAIWITLGKFKVQAVQVTPQNPDGYKLTAPYLDAAGNQEVTRGFYIFDRSIPMGFQRGQDINVERGMLIEHVLQLPQ